MSPNPIARVAVTGAVLETLGWLLATLLGGPDAWRHDISSLSAVGGEHAWLVLGGEAGLSVAVLSLAWLVPAAGLRGDHAAVATGLLAVAGVAFGVQALAREGGRTEPVHGPAAVLAVLALGCAPFALAVPIRAAGRYGGLATWCVTAAGLGLGLFALAMVPGLAGGLAQRGTAAVLTAWVAVTAWTLGARATLPTLPKVPREDRLAG